MFGCDTFGIRPDIMTVAKALSASHMPLSATIVSGPIHDAMVAQSHKLGNFAHGFTYAGHPVASAVALETLRIYEERDIVSVVAGRVPAFPGPAARAGRTSAGRRGARRGADRRAPTGEEQAAPGVLHGGGRAGDADHGEPATPRCVAARHAGVVYFCPPLIISEAEIDLLFDATAAALDEALVYVEANGLFAA